jgi:hypothetical protein
MPFALCLNGMPVARVPFDNAIGAVATVLIQIRRIVGQEASDFTVELCRLDSDAMQALPQAADKIPMGVIADWVAQFRVEDVNR